MLDAAVAADAGAEADERVTFTIWDYGMANN